MAPDNLIPSFLDLQRSRRKLRKDNSQLAAPPQLMFDLAPPQQIPFERNPPPSQPIIYTVRQLIAELRRCIESAYTGIFNVEGEISNCRPAASGHIYFTLKDGDAQLPVVIFRRQASLLGFKLRDGLFVELRGRISVYETRGQLQLIAESLRPRGEGALQLAFEQLKRRLRAEGLFDRERKPLPPFPHCIGIVTSPSGAALRDIINVARRRHARLNLLIYSAFVQGPQCPPSVIAGIRFFNAVHEARTFQVSDGRRGTSAEIPCVDLILIARGGGSLEDLAGFNDEALARAIAASHLPTVSAIGHEIDHTIADFVADLRAPTPSAAAELITAAQHRIEERVHSLERRAYRAAEYNLLRCRRQLERLSAEQVLARLRDSTGRREQRIDELRFRLSAAVDRRLRNRVDRLTALEIRLRRYDPKLRLTLANRRLASADASLKRVALLTTLRAARLNQAAARLEALSPLAVLSRGYAIVYTQDGTILRDIADVSPGQQIRARLAQGSVRATITETS